MRSQRRARVALVLGAISVPVVALVQEPTATFKQICPPCAPVAAAQGGIEDIHPGALKEPEWAVGPLGVNAKPWADAQKGRLLGSGATILQIDTGITQHPLLRMTADTDDRGVDINSGKDLYGPGHTNEDPLLAGFLRFPGHGTKTASVIVAEQRVRDGKPIEDGFTMVKGVAPGARLVAVRATQGVVLFSRQIGELEADQRKIAHALDEAAKGESGHFRRRIDVVSMSLGGWPPVAGLCESVARATKNNVIVLAAVGNKVRRTKYPAACDDTLAIAGSTYGQAPWSGSAGSETVAVAAPAEGVWTASVSGGQFCMDASSGTSFAVALVAGMAAEWVAFHRANKSLPGNLSQAFRAKLASSARPWTGGKAGGWSRKFGPGIADLERLMK